MSETKIEINRGRAQITSSVIGVLVLILSLVFFYAFLREVYQISTSYQETEVGNLGANSLQGNVNLLLDASSSGRPAQEAQSSDVPYSLYLRIPFVHGTKNNLECDDNIPVPGTLTEDARVQLDYLARVLASETM